MLKYKLGDIVSITHDYSYDAKSGDKAKIIGISKFGYLCQPITTSFIPALKFGYKQCIAGDDEYDYWKSIPLNMVNKDDIIGKPYYSVWLDDNTVVLEDNFISDDGGEDRGGLKYL